MSHASLLLALVLLFSLPVGAAHITDKLVVGLYAEAGGEGQPLRLIASGTPVEVLSSAKGFSEVRLADDTEGWVETRYVTEEKPAKAMLLETQARLRQMGLELAKLREQQAGDAGAGAETAVPADGTGEAALRARIDELEQRLADVSAGQVDTASLETLRAQSRQALATLAEAHGVSITDDPSTDQPAWFERFREWLIGLAALALGFVAGIAFIDRRIRRRYGGFRL